MMTLASLPAQSEPTMPDEPVVALAAMEAQPIQERGVQVEVLDADGLPVSDAIVVMVLSDGPHAAKLRELAMSRFAGDEPNILLGQATGGMRYHVDDRGRAKLPGEHAGRIVAVQGERIASTFYRPDPGKAARPIKLTLAAPMVLPILVRNAAGEPQMGVRCGVTAGDSTFSAVSKTTDANGQVVLRTLHKTDPSKSRLMAFVASRNPVVCDLPANGETATLTLPRYGSVHARLAGEPLPGATARWTLRVEDRKGDIVGESLEANQGTFPFVEAGIAGEVHCMLDDNVGRTVKFAGVVEAEQLEVTLPEPAVKMLAFRLLDPAGEPVRKRSVMVRWRYKNGYSGSGSTSNREGWLSLQSNNSKRELTTLEIEVRRDGWDSELLGTLELDPERLAELMTKREELQLNAAVVGVSGRLFTPDGKPAASVKLSATRSGDSDAYPAVTAKDGSFAALLPKPGGTVALSVADEDWSLVEAPGQSVDCDSGAQGVEIRVQRMGKLRMSVNGLPANISHRFTVRAESDDANQKPLRLKWDVGARELRLPPGKWDVVFLLGDEEVQRYRDVHAQPGVETHDPRFMFFDWQAWASVVTVHVQDKAGLPAKQCTVWHRVGGSSTGYGLSNGVVHWLVPKSGGHVVVEPNGGKEIDLGLVTGEQFVRLGTGPLLIVELSELPLLADGVELLLGVGDSWQSFGQERKAQLWLSRVASWRPKLALQLGDRRVEVDRQFAEVDVAPGGSTLKVTMDAALQQRIADAMRKLQ